MINLIFHDIREVCMCDAVFVLTFARVIRKLITFIGIIAHCPETFFKKPAHCISNRYIRVFPKSLFIEIGVHFLTLRKDGNPRP